MRPWIWLLTIFAGFMAGCAEHSTTMSRADGLSSAVDWTAAQTLAVTQPPAGAVLPCDMAAPRLSWTGPERGTWLVRFAPEQGQPLHVLTSHNPWVPEPEVWETVRRMGPGPITLDIAAMDGKRPRALGRSTFSISSDPFASSILYLEIPVPFRHAASVPEKFCWRQARLASTSAPAKVLSDLPSCANCHVVSNDGRIFGLDFDYRKDKGGFLLADTSTDMRPGPDQVMSWNAYLPGQGVTSRGLFARISPDGRHVAATVKDQPFLVRIDDPAYSQLFFPLTGKLVVLDRNGGQIRPLPGADHNDIVQTGPAWSADGRQLAFSRGQADPALWQVLGKRPFLDAPSGVDIHQLNRLYRMRFDLCTLPFNDGQGGTPEPLAGASGNGMSNYFPRFTPDGRWIVFCQAPNGLVSQPGSRLYIVPSAGGTARPMRCNRPELNSWHSISANGRWMVFSSKPDPEDRTAMQGDSLLTRIYLTHLDENGQDSPPVLLHRLASPERASILPELLPDHVPTLHMTFQEP